MRVASIGGGPGGLFLASLLKRRRPDAELCVLERNLPDATFGFGVVFSERTLDYLQAADPVTYAAIEHASVAWEDIEVRHRGRTLRCGGHGFSAVARKRLLEILQQRAADAGADLRFESEVEAIPSDEYDVVLGADGLNSFIREQRGDDFRPAIHTGAAKYIWFATPRMFDALTFIFEQNEHGHFAVHAYPFDEQTSTFIVETDEDSWRRAGLDHAGGAALPPGESDLASMEYCRELFAMHLDGEPLLVNNSKWLNFHTVRNASWRSGNVALLGDAAHTAHFSVGSGTKMAMEDAISLAAALADEPSVERALGRYEEERRPAVERIQAASRPSRIWWETFRHAAGRASEQFAFHFLTRTPRFVTRERIRGRDPRFVRWVEGWFAEEAAVAGSGDRRDERPLPAGAGALLAPLALGEVTLPNRLAVCPTLPHPGRAEEPSECDLVHLAGPALCGAGLVLAEPPEPPARPATSWERAVDLVHGHSAATAGLRLRLGGGDDPEVSAEAAAAARFDLLLVLASGGLRELPALVERIRRSSWPARKPLGVQLAIADRPPEVEPAVQELVEAARRLEQSGCDLVAVAAGGRSDHGDDDERHLIQLLASDRIRELTALRTLLVGGPRTRDEAVTAVLAGRADLCEGSPELASDRWAATPPAASARCGLAGGVGAEA